MLLHYYHTYIDNKIISIIIARRKKKEATKYYSSIDFLELLALSTIIITVVPYV